MQSNLKIEIQASLDRCHHNPPNQYLVILGVGSYWWQCKYKMTLTLGDICLKADSKNGNWDLIYPYSKVYWNWFECLGPDIMLTSE